MTTTKTERLPKWAQQHIARLENQVAYWKRKATEGPEGCDTFAGNTPRYVFSAEDNPPRPLGVGERVYFHLDQNDVNHAMIEAHIESRGVLSVVADNSLIVLPRAANSIQIVSERR